jgi:hypothetical protein
MTKVTKHGLKLRPKRRGVQKIIDIKDNVLKLRREKLKLFGYCKVNALQLDSFLRIYSMRIFILSLIAYTIPVKRMRLTFCDEACISNSDEERLPKLPPSSDESELSPIEEESNSSSISALLDSSASSSTRYLSSYIASSISSLNDNDIDYQDMQNNEQLVAFNSLELPSNQGNCVRLAIPVNGNVRENMSSENFEALLQQHFESNQVESSSDEAVRNY